MGKSQRGESSDCLPMSLTDPSTTHVWNRLSDRQLRSELGPELLPKKQNIKFKHSQGKHLFKKKKKNKTNDNNKKLNNSYWRIITELRIRKM